MHAVPALTVPAPASRAAGPIGLARAVAADPARWRPLAEFRPGQRWYSLLERTAAAEVWLLTWLPGQGTDLHDHGPASGAFAVAAGALTERVVSGRPGGVVETSRDLVAGRTRAFGPHYVHEVRNTGAEPAVSVHVYAPGLTAMTRYAVTGGGLVAVRRERAGVDW